MQSNPKIIDLIKKNDHIIGFKDHSTKIYQRLPISNKQYREIQNIFKQSTFDINKYLDLYKKILPYCLKDFPLDDFDNVIWESTIDFENEKNIFGLKHIIDCCLYRSVNGIAYFRLPSKTGLFSRGHLVN